MSWRSDDEKKAYAVIKESTRFGLEGQLLFSDRFGQFVAAMGFEFWVDPRREDEFRPVLLQIVMEDAEAQFVANGVDMSNPATARLVGQACYARGWAVLQKYNELQADLKRSARARQDLLLLITYAAYESARARCPRLDSLTLDTAVSQALDIGLVDLANQVQLAKELILLDRSVDPQVSILALWQVLYTRAYKAWDVDCPVTAWVRVYV